LTFFVPDHLSELLHDKLGEDKVITLSALLTEAVAAVDDIQQALI